MCYREGLPGLLQQVASRSERGESGNGIDGVSKSRKEYLNSENSGAPKGKRTREEIERQ